MAEVEVYDWLAIGKFSLFIILAGLKALAQSFITVLWILVGVFLATNYYAPVEPVRDAVLGNWGWILFFLFLFDGIVNFKEINRK